ncbi:MAG: hypothetical protein HRT73_12790 [Flavobacteriales bacterium]|nr:hypothetical protein [Flavobacteriales bacterium]
MDAAYNRPFLTADKMPVSLGGYLEANSIYSTEDGVTEGLSFQARRLTLFMSASISKRIKFLSEIEFEDGTKEIGIEFAALDVAFHPVLNFRGGIIMNPIGAFNQNHDGPKWEFVERPDVAVNMLAATWANAGFGLYGKAHKGNWVLGYEVYLTNGFNNSITDNEENKTFLPAAKANEERFEESNNGRSLFTGKLAIKNRKIGEIGFSYMGGIYNKFEEEGLVLDEERRLDVFAIDFNTTIKKMGTYIVGEIIFINIDVAETFTQQFGNKQRGAFVDIVQTVLKKEMFGWKEATFNIAARLDYVDWNIGTFKETGTEIGEDLWAISPAISFRPSAQTVFRINYRYQWQKDILSNPAAKTATWLFGISTYF